MAAVADGAILFGQELYSLKVTLRDVKPPVWRRIVVANG
ncbi:hypothetical protein BH24ACT6_BH24ACT6_01190 [soil metagenome]